VRHVVYRDACYSLNRALVWEIDRDRFVDAAERARRTRAAGSSPDAVATLERAVSAYGGPLFEGDPVADWFLAERTALHELFLQVLERLAGLLMERGDIDGAQRTLERLLRKDGCRESAHRLLMSCFARRGQRDLVARQFQRCIARLQADLDITPSTETVDLFRTLTRAG
jgi:DNA-binding SARP family transcriptional activator